VWARVRPTSEFAYDNLELLPDGKVKKNWMKVIFLFKIYQARLGWAEDPSAKQGSKGNTCV
jgi:hypothetical protein